MKLPETLPSSRRPLPKSRRGVALVTVLTVMALTTILVLTFFSLATSEHRASSTYSQGLQAQQVAEQAVNFVIAQIREATVRPGVTEPISWASQPGAIRVWHTNGQKEAFKLYSDDVMKLKDNWDDFQKDFADLDGWSSRPEHFVDLNEPVIRGDKVYYPIVHPAAAIEPEWPKAFGDDKDGVEGFRFNADGRSLADYGAIGAKAAGIAKTGGHVSMPVRWIYQLADGTFGVLSSGGGGSSSASYSFVATSGSGTPSAKNPIVARFAFWADDETSKLNINTHSGGLAWDIPKAGGSMDMEMGKHQPAQKEWQRYPGHPATTHLSVALAPGVIDIVNDRDAMEMLYRVVPRVVGGGSESGTRVINTRDPKEMNGLIADTEPLFPSLDDVIMRANRSPHEFPDAKGRPIPADELSDYLERAKFFITVSSRAPETNLFNKPRIAMWPISNASGGDYKTYLTTFDQLIHFCSSMGKNPGAGPGGYPRYEYIFKREKADSSTYDYTQITRNNELYNYLVSLLDKPVPGYGASFSDKYGKQGAAQLATMIFDYIRSTNLHDDTLYQDDFANAFAKENTNKHITYTNPRDQNEKGFGHKGHGQVTPIRIDMAGGIKTKGMGRFFTLAGAHIHAICAGDFGFQAPGAGNGLYPGVTQYNRGTVEPSEGVLYTNLPPLSSAFVLNDKNTWPDWLRGLKELADDPAQYIQNVDHQARIQALALDEFNAALDPAQWNWQLAFLDPLYRQNVLNNPTQNKYNRNALSAKTNVTRLQYGEKLVQAAFLFDLFSPSIGWGSINPDMEIHFKKEDGMQFFSSLASEYFLPSGSIMGFTYEPFLAFGSPYEHQGSNDTFIWATNWAKPHRQGGGRSWGGLLSFGYTLSARQAAQTEDGRNVWWQMSLGRGGGNRSNWDLLNTITRCRLTPLDVGYDGDRIESALERVTRPVTGGPGNIHQAYRYDLVTAPFKIGYPPGVTPDPPGPGEPAPPVPVLPEGAYYLPNPNGGTEPIRNGDIITCFHQSLDSRDNLQSLAFLSSEMNVKIYSGGPHCENSSPDSAQELVQEIDLDIPGFQVPAPVMSPGFTGYIDEFTRLSHDTHNAVELASLTADPGNPIAGKIDAEGPMKGKGVKATRRSGVGRTATTVNNDRRDWDNYGRMALVVHHWDSGSTYVRNGDVVQSVAIPHGDVRVAAAMPEIRPSDDVYVKHRNYGSDMMAHSMTNSAGQALSGYSTGDSANAPYLLVPNLPSRDPYGKAFPPYRNTAVPMAFTGGSQYHSDKVQLHGDFDNGAGLMIDGPYINKPDEGNVHSLRTRFVQEVVDFWDQRRNYGEFPYFSSVDMAEAGGPAYFSPNRIVSGPGMFGSLPTGLSENPPKPWQTLLFRPDVDGNGYKTHPGAKSPPDHVIMDLFWMPVVEPYAISEPLSTAGKVNMNFEIVPFLHVHRDTALRGVFRSEFMLCVPVEWHSSYKHDYGRGEGYHWRDNPYGGALQGKRLRTVIVEGETLKQFTRKKFKGGMDLFQSSTEICDIHLIPEEVSKRLGFGKQGSMYVNNPPETPEVASDGSVPDMANGKFWRAHALVGDNSRERPYTNIQTRLTTKSNTFQVHFRAQVLKQARRDNDADYADWRPATDSVQAEYRGSSIVERYVDPNGEMEDFAKPDAKSIDDYYRFRVINPRRFAP